MGRPSEPAKEESSYEEADEPDQDSLSEAAVRYRRISLAEIKDYE